MGEKKDRRNRNRKYILIPAGILLYALLLIILIKAESSAEGATIISAPAAVWYSITTLTTVGYGDMYPVTATGRAVGVLFQLMSLGVLAAVLGMIFSILRGRIIPSLILYRNRNRHWFILSGRNYRTELLAKDLEKNKDAFPLFAEEPFSVEEILEKRNPDKLCTVLLLGDSARENEHLALELSGEENVRVCCMTEHEPERLPANIVLFNPYQSYARLYWKKYPLHDKDEDIVMIGNGKYAFELLEQALLQNVMDEKQCVTYHLLGDFSEFMRCHPFLDRMVRLDIGDSVTDADNSRTETENPQCSLDRVILEGDKWNSDLDILASADRIIVCYDDENNNNSVLNSLFRYVAVSGKVYAVLSTEYEGAECMGVCDGLYTEEVVLQQELNRMAIHMHELYLADYPDNPGWQELGMFLRQSNIAAADHLEMKIRILTGVKGEVSLNREMCSKAYEVFINANENLRRRFREIEHMRWLRFHILNNWQYDSARDNARRRHPMICAFDELSLEDQEKDDHSWELLNTIWKDND
ncbi:MAG: hypothetical protein K6E33_07900 [Lachnospiraceae bacterium]|nr:hypothetical protein [Lachnospiraceae bacterium]